MKRERGFAPLETFISRIFGRSWEASPVSEGRAPDGAKRSPAGFTLLEVMLTVLLLAVGLTPLMGMFSKGFLGSKDLESMIVASNLAQEKMEKIKSTAYGNITDETEDYGTIGDFLEFKRAVTVSLPDTGLKQVVVTVYWTLGATEQEARLTTYIAEY